MILPCTKFLRELNFADRRFFCILRELIFAIVIDWFSLLGINFCDFQEVAFNLSYNIFVFYYTTCNCPIVADSTFRRSFSVNFLAATPVVSSFYL